MKIRSVFCNSSKALISLLNCTLVDVSRKTSFVNLAAKWKKPISNIKIDATVFHRQSGNGEFKRTIFWPKLDICKFAENIETTYSVLKSHFLFINRTFNGFIHRCPYNWVEFSNVSLSLRGDENFGVSVLPNGENKFRIQAYTNRDKNILLFEFILFQRLVKNKE